MSIKMTERQIGEITIVDISGRIALGDGTALLRSTVRNLIAAGKKNILLNLADVPYIDSSGIGELVSAFTAVRREGGDVKLLQLTRKVREVLQIVKLMTVFDVFDDEALALQAFATGKTRAQGTSLRAG